MIRLFGLLFFVCFFFPLFSQDNAIIRGYVFDGNTGDPIIAANIRILGEDIGTTTDLDGFFSLNKLSQGQKRISVRYLGYEEYIFDVALANSQIFFQNINLNQSGVELGVVDISAQRSQARTEVQISKISVSNTEILKLPSIGGEPDIIQYLQVLPGIVSTGDQGGQIYIRGGSPVQNKILLDGLTIYNPFHSIGFFSVFETQAIKNVDVLTGGFGAEYGNRISAIVDVKTRDGNRKNFDGQIALNPFLWKAFIEGPIVKYKEGGGSTSFILSTKNSWIDRTSPSLYSYANVSDSLGLPFKFNDHFGKLSFINKNGSKLNLFGFNYTDSYDNPGIANLNWKNTGGGADFKLIPGNSNLILNGMVGYSSYDVNLEEADGLPRESSIRGFVAAINMNAYGVNSEFNYGLEFNSFSTDFQFQNPFRIILGQNQNTTEISAFAKFRYVWNNLILEPSFRLQFYASLSEFSPEPRLALKYNVSDVFRIKMAGGRYSQNLLAAANERDVVNLFTGFLSGPEERIFRLSSSDVADSKLQFANHYIGGIEWEIFNNLILNSEVYYKDFQQLIIVNRNKLLGSDPNFSTEIGEAYGFDIGLDFYFENIDVKANYTLAYVNRFDGFQTYPTVFDRRHNVNLLGTYVFGADKNWTMSLRWNLGTGFPFTRTQGFYNYNSFQEGLSSDYLQSNPNFIGILYEVQRNAGRLPAYHRLDGSLTRLINFNNRLNMEIDLSVSNIYNRQNIFYFDRVTYERVNQLPVLISMGIKLNL